MARKFPPEFKRDVVTVARRSDATYEELASDFGISVNSLRRWMRKADVPSTAVTPTPEQGALAA